jgi:hypothetical protein
VYVDALDSKPAVTPVRAAVMGRSKDVVELLLANG